MIEGNYLLLTLTQKGLFSYKDNGKDKGKPSRDLVEKELHVKLNIYRWGSGIILCVYIIRVIYIISKENELHIQVNI